ncbi:hypothetical protein ENSA5_12170 [Enhygromyxa salina]|uniref:SNARE associated Golgi protein n=1 Tax=Enhygromyxa salina TaxID=215803 RepID=A0A2S9YFF1_9BACT|nr:hypothetical protein [Enhygromyxa salina]PRQ03848.1 hypothetical protein ENSA5_12170 [Enhygromyxa salina]
MNEVPDTPHSRKRWIAAFTAVMAARGLGLALFPVLLVEAPVVLILLSPILGHLVLTGALLPAWQYFAAALGGSIIQSIVAYRFGVVLGERAQVWLEGRGAATHAATTRILGWMKRAAPVVLIAMAGTTVCALAGVSQVRARVFYPAMIVAQVAWVGACFWFGVAVTDQIEVVLSFVELHVLELTAVALALVGGSQLWKRWRQKRAAGA